MSRQSGQLVDNRIDRKVAAAILSISQRTLDRHIKNKRVYSRKANGRVWLDKEDILKFKAAHEAGVFEATARQHRDLNFTSNDGIITYRQSRHDVDKVDIESPLTEVQKKVLSLLEQQVLHNDRNEKSSIIPGVWEGIMDSISQQISQNTIQQVPQNQAPQNIVVTAMPQQQISPTSNGAPSQFVNYYSEGIYQKLYEELKAEHKHNQKRIEAANYRVGQLEAKLEVMIPLLEYKKQKEKYRKLESGLKNQVHKREIQLKKARRMYRSEQFNKWIFAIIAISLIAIQPVIWLLQR